MGLYNFPENKLPEPLNKNRCAICDNSMVPVNEKPGLDAFQYRCDNCNPELLIKFSGSILADQLYGLMRKNNEVRNIFREKIRMCKEKKYPILITTLNPYFINVI